MNCIICKDPIPSKIKIGNKISNNRNRRLRCYNCKPYESKKKVKKVCAFCNSTFDNKIMIDGKIRTMSSRKYCLACSPFKTRNTRNLITKLLNKNCEECEKQLTGNQKKYCSRKCKGKYRKSPDEAKVFRYKKTKKALDYLGGKCIKCGYDKHVSAIDFHHHIILPENIGISRIILHSWDKVKKELDKCQLLCANCHIDLHHSKDNKNAYWYQRKLKAVEIKGGKCEKCGYKNNPKALCFHHLNDKKFALSGGNFCYSWDRIIKELNKCRLLCSNCHRELH